MQGITPNDLNCSSQCQPSGFSINGSQAFCSGSQNYSVNDVPTGANISWSVSPYGIVTLATNPDKSVTLTKVNDGGIVTLTASIPFCNSTATVSKQITVGSINNVSVIKHMSSEQCVKQYTSSLNDNTFVISNPGGSTYPLEIQNVSGALVHNINSPYPSTTVTTPIFHIMKDPNVSATTIYIQVRVAGNCGWSGWKTIGIPVCQSSFMYTVSPNPSHGNVSVKSKSAKPIDEIRIKDKLGNIKLSSKLSKGTKEAVFDISTLPADVYFIEIFDGKEWSTSTIIKN